MMRIPFYKFSQVFVFLILFLYCLITSPFLLVAMAMSGGGCYYASLKQVKISFHVFYICGMYFKTSNKFISIVYAVNQIKLIILNRCIGTTEIDFGWQRSDIGPAIRRHYSCVDSSICDCWCR